MGFGGAMFAVSAAQGVSQIASGYAQNSQAKANATIVQNQANYNASLDDNKAKLIDVQKGIDQGKYIRMKEQYLSTGIVNTAGQGIELQGSALASLIDTQTQINIDQSISAFNYDQEKNNAIAAGEASRRSGEIQANAYRQQGQNAVSAGYSNAFSSLLKGAATYGMYKYNPLKTKDTTFDKSTKTSGISWDDF